MDHATSYLNELRKAKNYLEKPSLAVLLTARIGAPIEKGIELLPGKFPEVLRRATRFSLQKALHVSMMTLRDVPGAQASERSHKILAATAGFLGGTFGLPALFVELPATTVLMMRSIAAIARNEGESIRSPEVKLACLEVFALGGSPRGDNAGETGYFAVRSMMSSSISQAARYLASGGLSAEGAPALVRLISLIASRFGIAVSEKAAAQALPLVGAAGGAMINTIFIRHFQDTARGHFMIRRLERQYGAEQVRRQYNSL